MRSTRASFGEELRQFARSVEIVDERTWQDAEDLVMRYVIDEFGMEYFAFMAEDDVGGQVGLRTRWTSAGPPRSKLLRDGERYNGQTALAFDQNRPLWIVRKDEGVLVENLPPDRYENQWPAPDGHQPDLPPYTSTIAGVRTSIIVPVTRGARVFGVLDFEDHAYRRFNEVAEAELAALASAVAILYELHLAHRTQKAGTCAAVRALEDELRRRRFPTNLSRPSLFVASADGADPAVMEVVLDAIAAKADYLRVADWRMTSRGGNVSTHTLQDIATARFGICYLSEPSEDEDGPFPFVDNPNVIFEAGMLHAFTNTAAEAPTQWLPIREDRCLAGEPPFDFAQERMIVVPRHPPAAPARPPAQLAADAEPPCEARVGELDAVAFRADLDRFLCGLLGIPYEPRPTAPLTLAPLPAVDAGGG